MGEREAAIFVGSMGGNFHAAEGLRVNLFQVSTPHLKVCHRVAREKWQEYLWGMILVISVASRESS